MRILFLSAWFPYPANNGSKLRIYNLLRVLSVRHEITLLSFTDDPDIDFQAPQLGQICRHVKVIPLKWFNPRSWHTWLGFFSVKPRSVIDTFSPEMAQSITHTLTTTNYDLIIASEIHMAGYYDYFAGIPALFEDIEFGILYERFAAATTIKQRLRAGLTWYKHRHYLAGLLRHFAAGTVVSEQDRLLLLNEVMNGEQCRIEVVPNCVDVTAYQGAQTTPRPDTLIYTGSFSFFPNYEAMCWFIQEVLPLVQAEIPDVQLIITGNRAGKPLPLAPHVRHVGFVDDVRVYVAASWISLAPIWSGGGTRLKILEAMALRVPVVATSKGAEGIEAVPGEHILVADTAVDFAAETIRLLRSETLRQNLTSNAYRLVCEKYDWTAVAPHFLNLVERTVNI